MNRLILLSIVLVSMAGIAHADMVNVTLNWTMRDTTGVEGYRIYYSYNSDMSGKMLHSECGVPSLSDGKYTMEFTNVNIDPGQLPVYLQVGAYDNTNETVSPPQKEVLLPVQDFTVSVE